MIMKCFTLRTDRAFLSGHVTVFNFVRELLNIFTYFLELLYYVNSVWDFCLNANALSALPHLISEMENKMSEMISWKRILDDVSVQASCEQQLRKQLKVHIYSLLSYRVCAGP